MPHCRHPYCSQMKLHSLLGTAKTKLSSWVSLPHKWLQRRKYIDSHPSMRYKKEPIEILFTFLDIINRLISNLKEPKPPIKFENCTCDHIWGMFALLMSSSMPYFFNYGFDIHGTGRAISKTVISHPIKHCENAEHWSLCESFWKVKRERKFINLQLINVIGSNYTLMI